MNDKQPTQFATTLAAEDRLRLESLRMHRRAHRQAKSVKPPTAPQHFLPPAPTRGERLADAVAATVGSWRFIIFQSTAIVLWIAGNAMTGSGAWDPFPFILLNLLLSFQAAYTAPAIMMSQNRLSEQDRRHAETDYEINVKAELEIELLHQKIDELREKEVLTLSQAVADLSELLQRQGGAPKG